MKEVSVEQPQGFFFLGGQGVLYTPVAIARVLKEQLDAKLGCHEKKGR